MAEQPGKLAPKNPIGALQSKPRLMAFRNDEITKAITSKLVDAQLPRPLNRDGNYQTPQPNSELVWNVTDKTANNIADNRNMMQLLPDIELAKQILINSILSPNDMLSCELTFNCEAELLGEVQGPMLQIIEDFFKKSYGIEQLMPVMLEDILFKTGSYPMAIVPESAIDDAINSPERVNVATFESIRGEFGDGTNVRSTGILGSNAKAVTERNAYSVGLENLRPGQLQAPTDTNVGHDVYMLRVTDNPNVMKQPLLMQKIATDRIRDKMDLRQISTENREQKKTTDAQLRASLFRSRTYINTPVVQLKPKSLLDKATVGHPMVMTLPAEAVIPVHTPGNPDEHVGYFVLLDQTGNPLNKAIISDYYTDLATNINQNKDLASQLLNTTRRAIEGRKPGDSQMLDIDSATQLYMDVVEQDLMQRLRNGVYGDNVAIAKPQEVYRIMLARACAKMYTQLLYVPAQVMTYMAFEFNKHGVGMSLLENTKIIGSLRAMTLFANTMAGIKNSVGHVELNIELDPNDPDPGDTIEKLMHEYVKTRQAAYPIGASNPLDIVNYLQAAGVEVTTTGHPGWPTTKMSVNDKQTNRPKVDTDLEDSLRKRHLMSLGVAPETVELSMGADFATSIIQSNLLLAKRALVMGKKFTFQLTDFIKKFTLNSQILMDLLKGEIEKHKDLIEQLDPQKKYGTEGLVIYFISLLEVSLPEPNLKGLAMQLEAFDEYNKALDACIPAFISQDIFDATNVGELSNTMGSTIAVIKAYFQRKWLRENNVLPELFEMMSHTEDDDHAFDLLESHKEHMDSIGRSILSYMKAALESKQKFDAEVLKMNGGETLPDTGGAAPSGGGGDSGTGSDEFGGGDEGGTGEFDFGEPPALPGEEGGAEPPAEEAPPEGGEETPPA
jgi:hypothetical protein